MNLENQKRGAEMRYSIMNDKQTISLLRTTVEAHTALKERLAELILKNHDVIDYTGFEDVEVSVGRARRR